MHGGEWVRQHRGMQNENRPIGTGGRSSVDRLPAQLREAVDAAIADGATIDEITARIRAGGEDCSRSAVGRYSKDVRALIRRQQETDRTVKAWMQELGARPEGGTGRILIETLQSMVLDTMADLRGRDEPASTQELDRLSHILKRIEATEKLCRERERAAEKAKAEKAKAKAEKAEKAAEKARSAGQAERQGGLSAETVAAIHEAVLGRPLAPARTVTSVPVDPWNPAEFPAVPVNPGESHSIPDDPGESQSQSIPANPGESRSIPANPGESHSIPDDCSKSQSQSIRDSHYESWEEIAPRVYRTSPTSILSLGPANGDARIKSAHDEEGVGVGREG